MEPNHEQFLRKASQLLGDRYVISSPDEIEVRSRDTVPGRIQPLAFIYPGSADDISKILKLANEHGVSVWPHSSGRNWGWSNSPTSPGSVMMILERMNRILHVDEDLAYAVIEPGVSYADLNNYLKDHKIKLWADCTAGPPKGSVLGNALDRGVGVTTHGEHFASLCGLEVVLPDGKIIRTGGYPDGKDGTRYTYKYGTGPFVEGLFSQGNLGVVTQGGVWLMPEPEAHIMFGFTMKDEHQLPSLFDALRKLALHGVIPDKIRVTNDFAVLTILTQWIHEKTDGKNALTPEDMKRLDDKYHIGVWAFCSSLYGTKEQVAAMRKVVTRDLRPYGRILFFSDRKIRWIEKGVSALLGLYKRRSRLVNAVAGFALKLSFPMVQALPPLYENYKGVPGEYIVRRAYFRSPKERPEKDIHVAKDQIGLMWFGPLVPMEGKTVFDLIVAMRTLFHTHEFNFYLTALMLNARTIVPLVGIIYRQEEPSEVKRAMDLYQALMEEALRRGYQPFRCGRLGWPSIFRDSPGMLAFHEKIKEAFDPHHILSPGKYGIQ